MDLNRLRILHLSKKSVKSSNVLLKEWFPKAAFSMETCQRWLSVDQAEDFSPLSEDFLGKGVQIFQGKAAYLFLLRLAAGLESEIQGETDVFGQLKEAWRKHEELKGPWVKELGPWIRKVFEDTKEIRSRYLQNLGGNSYGTLVRKLIKDQQEKGPTFLVGAGQIAQSIAPFLLDFDLWIWNRTVDRAEALLNNLSSRNRSNRMVQISILEEESKGWKEATSVVVCTPFDKNLDYQRLEWLKQRERSGFTVIHLGGYKEHSGGWSSVPKFQCLSDLFDLQNAMKSVRNVQISHAERACEERARLRALNIPLSVFSEVQSLATFA